MPTNKASGKYERIWKLNLSASTEDKSFAFDRVFEVEEVSKVVLYCRDF